MRVFLDQGVPHGIRRDLRNRHEVVTAAFQRWHRIKNGDLLEMVETAGFDVMISVDKDFIAYDKKPGRKLALIVLGNGNWNTIKNYLSEIAAAIDAATSNSYVFIEMPLPPKRPFIG